MLTYIVLIIAIICGVMQATLDRAGIGQVELLKDSPSTSVILVLSIPITVLSNIGLIAICIWSIFALKAMSVLITLSITFISWSVLWSAILRSLRKSDLWESVISIGILLVFFLRLITASLVTLLALTYLHLVRL